MRLKKLLVVSLIVSILSIGLGVTAFATNDPNPWSIHFGTISTLPK